jgi:hypothetical protein
MIPQSALDPATPPGILYALALIVHVGAGAAAIVAGGVALAARKGGRLHRAAGGAFVAAMLAMCALATLLSIARQPGTIIGGILTFYLVATARMTVRRAPLQVGRFETLALAVVIGCALVELAFGWQASRSPGGRLFGYPPSIYYVFGLIAALAAAGDVRVILRGGVAGSARLARHVWRMCFALFIATGSFFLGQQKIMPAFLHGATLLTVLGVAPLALMLFWLVRIRRGHAAATARGAGALRAAGG